MKDFCYEILEELLTKFLEKKTLKQSMENEEFQEQSSKIFTQKTIEETESLEEFVEGIPGNLAGGCL